MQTEPILILKTYDRHSGELKTHPVFYREWGEHYVVVASNEMGTCKPEWYLNLKEEPMVEIEVQGHEVFAIASTPVGSERLEIWTLVQALSIDIKRYLPRNVTGVLLTPIA